MSKIPISVCIIAKNEERYIEGCLKQLKPFGFEIVVADTGSTDRTKEIAEKYADKVVDFKWIDDFAAARNFCAEYATNNWILALDCDEYMSEFDYPKIHIMMQKLSKSVGMFRLKNLMYGKDGEPTYTIDEVVRFYNKKRFTWVDPIHEQLVKINDKSRYTYFRMPMEVIHHGYSITAEEMEQKQIRNLRMLEKHLEKEPENAYIWFQIGQSQFVLHHYDKAVEAYETALSLEKDFTKLYMEVLIESLAKTYMNLERAQDAVNLLLKYAEHFKTAKYQVVLSDAYMANKDILRALMSYIRTVSMDDRDRLGDSLPKCYRIIIDIYRDMGQDDMADMYVDLYEKCRQESERVINK